MISDHHVMIHIHLNVVPVKPSGMISPSDIPDSPPCEPEIIEEEEQPTQIKPNNRTLTMNTTSSHNRTTMMSETVIEKRLFIINKNLFLIEIILIIVMTILMVTLIMMMMMVNILMKLLFIHMMHVGNE